MSCSSNDHVAQIDGDAECDPRLSQGAVIPLGHPALHLHRASGSLLKLAKGSTTIDRRGAMRGCTAETVPAATAAEASRARNRAIDTVNGLQITEWNHGLRGDDGEVGATDIIPSHANMARCQPCELRATLSFLGQYAVRYDLG